MANKFAAFYREMEAELDQAADGALELLQDTAIKAFKGIQGRSPVYSGQYRAAHTLTLNAPSGRRVKREDWRRKTDQMAPIAAAALAEAIATLTRIRSFKQVRHIFITNTTRQASIIEHGKSDQAPRGVYAIEREIATRAFEDGMRRLRG